MIIKILFIFILSSNFLNAQEEEIDILTLMKMTKESASKTAEVMKEDIKNPEDVFFPDDSYVAIKCTRNRSSVIFMEPGGSSVRKKDYSGKYYHKPYVNVEYFSISPSQKKGMIVSGYIYLKDVDTDMYRFYLEEFYENTPYESTEFYVDDYSYTVRFRNSNTVRFNREDLSYYRPGTISGKLGSCEIMKTDDFIEDIVLGFEKIDKLKNHNEQNKISKEAALQF
jgi:hypothetical protein